MNEMFQNCSSLIADFRPWTALRAENYTNFSTGTLNVTEPIWPLILSITLKNQNTPDQTLLDNLPLIRRDSLYNVTTLVRSTTSLNRIIYITASILNTESLQDGISFYDDLSTNKVVTFFNDTVSWLQISQFGGIPLSRHSTNGLQSL